MNMQTRSDVTDKYRYVCNNSVKHNVQNSLWYAFVTDGDVVTLPAGSPQGLEMGPSLQVPFDTAAMDGTDVLVGPSVSSY